MATIPIVVGVSGHRDIIEADRDRVFQIVRALLSELAARCPNSEITLLSSLAAGADQIAAEAALSLGMRLVCPLPLPVADYRRDFAGADEARFLSLLDDCDHAFSVPPTEEIPTPCDRDFWYRQAGIYVAAHAHILLALWDGSAPSAGGCGTAEAVDFMLNRSYTNNLGACLRIPGEGAVCQLVTPRTSNPDVPDAYCVRYLPEDTERLFSVLAKTDAFNRDAAAYPVEEAYPLLDGEQLLAADDYAKRLHELYAASDSLSNRFRGKYLSYMKRLSALGVALTLFFLLYDEMELTLFLPFYALALIAAVLTYVYAARSDCHRKYLEYRAFCETLRVQFYLDVCGVNHSVTDDFTWSQRHDLGWALMAVSALSAGDSRGAQASSIVVKRAWIDGQLNYHLQAQQKTKKLLTLQGRITKGAAALTVALFVLTAILEFGFPSLAGTKLSLAGVPDALSTQGEAFLPLRGLLKILLGASAAAALFFANYYGKLSLSRKCADHERMAILYDEARRLFSAGQEDRDALLIALAREEIVENGGWLAYCRDNAPTINL